MYNIPTLMLQNLVREACYCDHADGEGGKGDGGIVEVGIVNVLLGGGAG